MNKKAEIKNRIDLINRGEIPEGYKKVHGYIIPNDWNIVPIKKIARQVKRSVEKPSESYYRLSVRSHAKGTFHSFVENPETVAMEELFQVKENDLIVNITFAWEHAIAIVKKEDNNLLVSHRFPTYEFNSNASVKFYENIIKLPKIKKMLSDMSPGGAGRNRVLNQTDFYNSLYIPYTNFKEQEKIAKILNCCDKVIELKQKLLELKAKEQCWIRQNILTGKIRFPKFKKNWENVKLKDILYEHKQTSTGKEIVCSVAVKKGIISQVEHLGKYCAADDTSNYNLVEPGNIVYTKSPTGQFPYGIIKQSKLLKNVIVSPLYGVFRPKNYEIGAFLDEYFKSYVYTNNYLKPIIQKGAKNTINITNTTFLSNYIKIPVDIEEQKLINKLIDLKNNEIANIENEINEFKQLKKSLSQLLLTGIVRTVEV